MHAMNLLRHEALFDPTKVSRVDVIGCGAIGSKIALSIAKVGVTNLHVWDFDNVEAHNIPNQAFGIHHVGLPKVEATAKIIKEYTGIDVVQHNEKVKGERLGQVVLVAVDSMAARKEIFESSIKFKVNTECMIETRMGIDSYRVYTIDPRNPKHISDWYEASKYTDEEVPAEEVGACHTRLSIGSTSGMVAEHSVWQFLKWFANTYPTEHFKDRDNTIDFEVIVALRPSLLISTLQSAI